MDELTIVILCQDLRNLTYNRCNLIENSNISRYISNIINSKSSIIVTSASPNIMLSEVFLIFFVLAIWLSAIGFCLNQYKSLRRLETQVHYCVNRKDPLNIGEIKIVKREQDSIIYKKKRYSTLLHTHISSTDLKAMHYVQQYLPKPTHKTIPSTLSVLVNSRDDLTASIPLSMPTGFTSSTNIPLSTHHEVIESQSSIVKLETNEKPSYVYRTGNTRKATGLTVPNASSPSSLRSSWNTPHMYDESCSTQHLCVPSNRLRYNRHSDGNISLPVPQIIQKPSENSGEQLIDPRLIPEAVRRSLLALHRESQENVNMYRKKENTQSENDVNKSFIPWKIKMKSKLKRTHNYDQQFRLHSNTLSNLPIKHSSHDHDRQITIQNEYQYSRSSGPLVRRSLKHYPKNLTHSTSESETIQVELPIITNIYLTKDNDELAKTIIEKSL